jgi:hypothetical protein
LRSCATSTAVSRNGWFYFSKPEITQPEIYISLQQSGKSSPLREAAERQVVKKLHFQYKFT